MLMSRRSKMIDALAEEQNLSKKDASDLYDQVTENKSWPLAPGGTFETDDGRKITVGADALFKLFKLPKPKDTAGGGYMPQKKARKAKLDYRKAGYFT